jgi:hypothetical protein
MTPNRLQIIRFREFLDLSFLIRRPAKSKRRGPVRRVFTMRMFATPTFRQFAEVEISTFAFIGLGASDLNHKSTAAI